MAGVTRDELVEAIGAPSVLSDGRVVVPATIEEVACVAGICARTGTPMEVASGDASSPEGADAIVISLRRLDAVVRHEGNHVLEAGAGALVGAVRSAAEEARLSVPGLPGRSDASRVGGLVARGEVPRRALTGIEFVLSTGEVVRAGGMVLKDVTGYDFPAVALGSMGRIGIVVRVWFRLQPASARVPAPPPGGRHGSQVGPSIAAAFDPGGLLRPRD